MTKRISLGQIDVKLGRPAENLAAAAVMAAQAAARRSDLLVLPELWSTGYDLENAGRHATAVDEGIFDQVRQLARDHRLHIAGSCLSKLGENQFGNTLVWFTPTGELLATYSKLHLFRLMQEEQYLTAGDTPCVVDTPLGRTGLAICYDLRFPELFRRYALDGAHLFILPSEWPHPRLAHWRTLLRARAVENQAFVIACNRVGTSKETDFFGHSCIIDPWGEIVIEGGESVQLLTADIEPGIVNDIRAKIPIFEDRRPEHYRLNR